MELPEGLDVLRDGTVIGVRGKPLKTFYNEHGYECIKFRNKHYKVHRLVAMKYIPNPYNYPYVNHLNEVRDDNRVENLDWCTARMNSEHSISKFFEFRDPDGNIHKCFNLRRFCEERGLCRATMNKVYHGKRNQYKGWRKV